MQSIESFHKKSKRKSQSRKTNEFKLKLSDNESTKKKSSISPRKAIKNKKRKNFGEIHSKKNRRSSMLLGVDKIKLDLSNTKLPNYKFSISPRKKLNNKDKNMSIKKEPHFNKIKYMGKHISQKLIDNNRNSCFNPFKNEFFELSKNDPKRLSFELLQTKERKFYQKFNFKESAKSIIKNKNIKDDIRPSELNIIGNDIKYALNNMITKLEKTQARKSKKEFLSPTLKKNKMSSSPELEFFFAKKKLRHCMKKIRNHHYLSKRLIFQIFLLRKKIKGKGIEVSIVMGILLKK